MEQQSSFSKLEEPIFSSRKSLLSVGQYAARRGVSTGIVEQCAKLGVVQVRKHKDKTFIVDLPMDTYNILKKQDSPATHEEVDTELCANKITELVNKIFVPEKTAAQQGKTVELTPRKHKPVIDIKTPAAPVHLSPVTMPDLELFAEVENSATAIELQKNPEPGSFRITRFRNITDSVRAISLWKLSSILLTTAFVLSLCAYGLVSLERTQQQKKLRNAYASITMLLTKYDNAKQEARLHEFDMAGWRSEAERAQKTASQLEAELAEAKSKLIEAQKDLQTMQQFNSETLKELNERVTRISSQLSGRKGQ